MQRRAAPFTTLPISGGNANMCHFGRSLRSDARVLPRRIPRAIAIENGEPIFDFTTARYSVSGEGKCVLHLRSEERNAVRRVLDAELKSSVLRLSVLRFGQSQPSVLEICAATDRRTPTALHAIRSRYRQVLERVLLRHHPGWKLDSVSSRADLEHSCSPVYTRGLLRMGQSASTSRRPSPRSTPRSPSAFSGWIASASSLPVALTSRV